MTGGQQAPRSRQRETHRLPPVRRGRAASSSPTYEVVRHLALPVPDDHAPGLARRGGRAPRGLHDRDLRRRGPRRTSSSRSACCSASSPSTRRPAPSTSRRRRSTPERLRRAGRDDRGDGPGRYETVALTPGPARWSPSRRSPCPSATATTVFQWGTFVHREHRGHRLGLAVKAANLRAAQALPRRPHAGHARRTPRPTTSWSRSTSEMGFEAVEVSTEFVKRL